MMQYGDLNRNVDTDDILLLMDERDAEYCMDAPSMFHMGEYYFLKSQSHDPDTPTYMKALSGENAEKNSRKWMMKFKVSLERTHGRLF